MRVGAYQLVSAFAVVSCTQVLGIDGRYVLNQDGPATGGAETAGAGAALDSSVEAGGTIGGGGASTGGLTGAGGTRPGTGGTGMLGSGGTGGAETGGLVGSGGSGGTLGSDGEVPCAAGEKRCPSVGCVMPDPSVGCDLDMACTPCTYPKNSTSICTNSKCDFQCYGGFDRNTTAGTCDLSAAGTGGAAGAGGVGTIGARCTTPTPVSQSKECVKCGIFPGCCNAILHCGCLYVAACI
jgi:hypothetical protein